VAFDGDYINSPVVIYNQGQIQRVAGTSLGAPAWAGLIAIADQGLATVGKPALSTAKALAGLYQLPSDFHDATSGYNGYSAGRGYDLVTGLGSPIANKLVVDLDNTVARVSEPLAPEGQGANQLQLIQDDATVETLNNSSIVAAASRVVTTAADVVGAQHTFNTNKFTAGAVGPAGTIPVQLGNGVGDQVTLLGSGDDGVLSGDGNSDSVSVSGDGNDTIRMDDGGASIHPLGRARRKGP
jgi:hypothetical protein